MILVQGLRQYVDKGVTCTKDAFLEKKWKFESVKELFENAEAFIQTVPEDERWNLFYTTAHIKEDAKGRKFAWQDVVPFDLDYVDYGRVKEYIDVVSTVLSVEPRDMAILASGNGLQFIVQLAAPIYEAEFFRTHKKHYNALCADIMTLCLERALPIREVDTSVFKTTQLMRMPFTKNIKDGIGERATKLLNATINEVGFDLIKASRLPDLAEGAQCSDDVMKNFPTPDTQAILKGCEFIKWAKENPNDVREYQWFSMLTVLGRLENGHQLAHDYSREHRKYSFNQTERKLAHAITRYNPVTCSHVQSIWDGCGTCQYYGKRKAPITITAVKTITERHIGFYHAIPTVIPGEFKQGKPHYNALMQKFSHDHNFSSNKSSGIVSLYQKTHWKDATEYEIASYCESNFDPKPTTAICTEFLHKLQRNNLVESGFFDTNGMVNLTNGILDYSAGTFEPHSPKHGFKYVLPYEYDENAKCPIFDKYLVDVMRGDSLMADSVMEFLGATLASAPSDKVQKALILTGGGSNGKSTFIDTLRALLGEGNYSDLKMGSEIEKMENRYALDGKLANISEELSKTALNDSSLFKAVVTGGYIMARKLYSDAYSMKANAKIIMLCNSIPRSNDTSYGFRRRLLIVDFGAKFEHGNGTIDVDIREKMLGELSGIFNRAMQGYHRLVQNKYKFSNFAESEKRVQRYMDDTDEPWIYFCEDNLLQKGDGTVLVRDVYMRFREWCMERGVVGRDLLNEVWLSRKIKERYTIFSDRGAHGRFFSGLVLATIQTGDDKNGF